MQIFPYNSGKHCLDLYNQRRRYTVNNVHTDVLKIIVVNKVAVYIGTCGSRFHIGFMSDNKRDSRLITVAAEGKGGSRAAPPDHSSRTSKYYS